jgi:hypothetical protein
MGNISASRGFRALVWREMTEKVADLGLKSLDGFLDTGDLVRAEIVHDDAITGGERTCAHQRADEDRPFGALEL